jgi:hypothetical protein
MSPGRGVAAVSLQLTETGRAVPRGLTDRSRRTHGQRRPTVRLTTPRLGAVLRTGAPPPGYEFRYAAGSQLAFQLQAAAFLIAGWRGAGLRRLPIGRPGKGDVPTPP